MLFLCPFLHCKALRTAMYKRYINIIIIIINKTYMYVGMYAFLRGLPNSLYLSFR